MDWGIDVHEALFLGGLPKGEFLREFEPDFLDDQTGHVENGAPCAGRACGRWRHQHGGVSHEQRGRSGLG